MVKANRFSSPSLLSLINWTCDQFSAWLFAVPTSFSLADFPKHRPVDNEQRWLRYIDQALKQGRLIRVIAQAPKDSGRRDETISRPCNFFDHCIVHRQISL